MLRYIILLSIIENNEGGEGWSYLKSLQAKKIDKVHEEKMH